MSFRYIRLRRNLLHHWFCGHQSMGGLLRDEGRFGRHGVLTGSTNAAAMWVPSGDKYSLLLNGTDDYVDLGTQFDLTQCTIAAWINWDGSAGRQCIVGNGNSGGSALNYWFEVNRTANKLSFLRSSATVAVTGNVSIPTNTWTHVAVTVSGGTGAWTCSLFVNGVLDNSAVETNNPTSTGEQTCIGRSGAYSGDYFGGYVDDVGIWRRPLMPDEIPMLTLRRGILAEREYTPEWLWGSVAAAGAAKFYYHLQTQGIA